MSDCCNIWNNLSRYTDNIMNKVCLIIMGFQHDLVNYVLVFIHLTQNYLGQTQKYELSQMVF